VQSINDRSTVKNSVMLKKQTSGLATLKSKVLAAALIVITTGVVFAVLAGDLIEDTLIEGASPCLPLLTDIFSYIGQGALNVISTSGYVGIFILMLLESSSLPIPSEVILPFSGYLASQGHLNLWLIVSITTIAGLAGSLIDYYLGVLLGLEGIKKLRYLSIRDPQLESAVKWFNTYGSLAVLGSRLIPGFRTLISFPAGIVRMKMTKFLSYTVFGCALWNTTLAFAGFYAGVYWQETITMIRYLTIIAIITIPLVLILYYLVLKPRHKRQIPREQRKQFERDGSKKQKATSHER
jgi:membrane protein DedA with SNARE-associated domain